MSVRIYVKHSISRANFTHESPSLFPCTHSVHFSVLACVLKGHFTDCRLVEKEDKQTQARPSKAKEGLCATQRTDRYGKRCVFLVNLRHVGPALTSWAGTERRALSQTGAHICLEELKICHFFYIIYSTNPPFYNKSVIRDLNSPWIPSDPHRRRKTFCHRKIIHKFI